MKKSTIWLLTIIMALTFGILLYFQVTYLESMVRMRKEQFSENVMRALYGVGRYVEEQETLYYLEQDPALLTDDTPLSSESTVNVGGKLLPVEDFTSEESARERYRRLQNALKYRFRYQQSLLNEVVISIIQESASRPADERVDSAMVRKFIASELSRRGINVPFSFCLVTTDAQPLYATSDFDTPLLEDFRNNNHVDGLYSIPLFPNSDVSYTLLVDFPTEKKYVYRSVRYIIPTLAFTAILLVIFIYTVLLAFRQKKLSEMKNDFINNMTHEFKTPISTISLAAQMLNDQSVRKSPETLQHISNVINDETKRLRFQVEKVLQMSMFDKKKGTLRMQDVDANLVISNVVNTFRLKVEKYGGRIDSNFDAVDAIVNVDEMHFTNVIFNLLDNAFKYRNENRPLQLSVSTRDISNQRLEIVIADNGIGIRKEDLKKIFEKFYRVSTGNRHDVKGFGLGLAYVHKMVTLMGGEIKTESELGRGTRFVITLPLLETSSDDETPERTQDSE